MITTKTIINQWEVFLYELLIIQQKYCDSTEKFLKNVEKLYNTLGPQESLSEVFEILYTLGKEFICDIAKNLLENKDSDLRKVSKMKEENYVLKGYRNRTITAKFGSVTFRRSYWYDADTRSYVTPLDM